MNTQGTHKLDFQLVFQYLKRGGYNFIFYSANTAIVRALNLFILPYFLSKLTLEEFGILDYYQMLFSIGIVLLTSSAATGMIRFFLFYKDNQLQQKQVFGNSFLFGLISCLLFFICGTLVTTFISVNYLYTLFTVVSISSFSLFSLLLAYFRAQEKLYHYTFFFLTQNLISIGLTCYGIAHHYGIISFFYAQCVSYSIFIPVYLFLFLQYPFYSYTIFKQQLKYSLPLAVASLLAIGLNSLDRSFIKLHLGYEALGIYALLGRFGSIFQFVCIALIDAWPILLFNADKEKQSDELIAKLINYCCIIFATLTLYLIIASKLGITLFFPHKLYHISSFLPLFFFPLFLAEIARMFQSVFGVTNKTIFVPVQMALLLVIQYGLYCLFKGYELNGIMIANIISFSLYIGMGYWLGKKVQSRRITSTKKIAHIIALFTTLWTVLMVTWQSVYSTPWCIALLLLWPLLLWMTGLIDYDEKKLLANFFSYFFSRQILNKKDNAILYIRSDICSTELTAGGSVAHTLGVIQALQNSGRTVLVASSSMSALLKKMELPYFKKLKSWPLFFLFRWKLGYLKWRLDCILSTFVFALQIRSVFKQYKIHYIYQRYSLLNATGVLLSKFKKIPLILEYNGSEVWQFDVLGKGKWFKFNRLGRWIEKINLQNAHTIVVVSQALKDSLLIAGIPEHKILVNPNGVDASVFDSQYLETNRGQIRAHYDIEQKFVFGFVGTFSFWHGIEVLSHIIPEIIQQKPNVHFMLIGDGTLKDFLQRELTLKKVIKYVTFTGIIEQHKAKEYLAACDAFFSPTQPNADGTRFFGSPTKLFEYMSMGKPIIASRLEQIAEIINPALLVKDFEKNNFVITNELGILVDPTNNQEFIQAACALIEMSFENRIKLGTNARNKVLENYTWNHHVNKIEAFFYEIKKEMRNESRTS